MAMQSLRGWMAASVQGLCAPSGARRGAALAPQAGWGAWGRKACCLGLEAAWPSWVRCGATRRDVVGRALGGVRILWRRAPRRSVGTFREASVISLDAESRSPQADWVSARYNPFEAPSCLLNTELIRLASPELDDEARMRPLGDRRSLAAQSIGDRERLRRETSPELVEDAQRPTRCPSNFGEAAPGRSPTHDATDRSLVRPPRPTRRTEASSGMEEWGARWCSGCF